MKIGTYAPVDEAQIRAIADAGFDFVELKPDDRGDCLKRDPLELKRAIDDCSIFPTGHCFDTDKAGAERVKREIRWFAGVGVEKIVVHPMQDVFETRGEEYAMDANIRFMAEAVRVGEENGVLVTVETQEGHFNEPEDVKALLDAVGGLGLTVDIDHIPRRESVPAKFVQICRENIGRLEHVHLSDNTGKADMHMTLGEGTMDWMGVMAELKALGYDKTILVESEHPLENAVRGMELLRGLD